MSDIVTALRKMADGDWLADPVSPRRAADEIERLREQLRLANIDNFNTTAEANKLRAERDDARRGLCYEVAAWVAGFKHSTHEAESRAEAARRGWDCFKENA